MSHPDLDEDPSAIGDARWTATKVITIPAEPAPAPSEQLPPLLQGFGAVPPLVSDIDLRGGPQMVEVSRDGRRDCLRRAVLPARRRVSRAPCAPGQVAGRRRVQRLLLLFAIGGKEVHVSHR